jgi:PEP-CTERM motif-containing protein
MKKTLSALALVALAFAPFTAEAISLGAESVFTPSVGGCVLICLDAPAGFLLTNNSAIGGNITQVTIDMSTAASTSAVFGGSAGLTPNMGFQSLTGASDTGFTSASVTSKIITLNFAGFDPGDVLGFSFVVDIDDNTRTVTAAEFAGSTLKVVFGSLGTYTGAFQPVLYDVIAKAEVYGTTRVPEPGSLVLVGVSLLVFVWLGRKHASAVLAN